MVTMVRCWYMDDSLDDQRMPHHLEPPQFVPIEDVAARTAVEHYRINADDHACDETLKRLRAERGYDYEDLVHVTPQLLPGYKMKLKMFFSEHIHTEEEIRLVLDGSGYFDVRDEADRWVRLAVERGDLLILPAGIYHRFTLDDKDYIKVARYFQGLPVWTPVPRGLDADNTEARRLYVSNLTIDG